MAQVSKEIKKLQDLAEIDLRNGQRERIEKWLRAIHSVRTEKYQDFWPSFPLRRKTKENAPENNTL